MRLIPPQYINPRATHSRRAGIRRLAAYIGKPCPYCGERMERDSTCLAESAPSRDHMTPIWRGGSNAADNILICCRACNVDKGSLDYEEYRAVRAGLASRIDRQALNHRARSLLAPYSAILA